ncbi:hypothetical protein [Paraburkholderia sp. CI3]|uniref:hypothetical protein n=1 Tax=Paraburkholderia sp. CI3 TaxID=2991060 RepID=UPI003D1C2EA6
MHEYLVRHSALSYLNQWYVTDRKYLDLLASSDVAATPGARIQLLSAKYMVARNFVLPDLPPNDADVEIERLWDEVALAVTDAAADNACDASSVVVRLANGLGAIFPDTRDRAAPNLLSAATKFLWFSGRHDIRIYDKRAIIALNAWRKEQPRAEGKRGWRVNGSYADFAGAWSDMYAVHQPSVRLAIASLNEAIGWSLVPDGQPRDIARAIFQEQWFHDRVFDKYLWTIGVEDESRVGAFV